MTWLHALDETYRNAASFEPGEPPLPLGHSTQQAHVEVRISDGGRFLGAEILDPPQETIIPVTEDSAGRTNKPAAHGLADKLEYLASELSGAGDPASRSALFLNQLADWCSRQPHPSACAVLAYLRTERLVSDLAAAGVLQLDETGNLLSRANAHASRGIFHVLPPASEQASAFVRWKVERAGDAMSKTWDDAALHTSWISYVGAREGRRGLCIVSGRTDVLIAGNHPRRIRHGADGAKLISSNDKSGYTYRGRFVTADQAATISSEVSQGAHNALRWLIRRQGFRNGDQVIVAWAPTGEAVPPPLVNTADLFAIASGGVLSEPMLARHDFGQGFAAKLSRLMAGYRAAFDGAARIAVLALDSAVPGRMAVTYFRDLTGSEFLNRIEHWHNSFAWWQDYGRDQQFVGAPAPKEIAAAAYGRRLDEKLSRATVERLLPCILDGQAMPRDLVRSVVHRASRRSSFRPREVHEWRRVLGIGCALFKGSHLDRNYHMALETERDTRDYLYGRLLAVAEHLEGRALYFGQETRETGAERLMQRFADHPFSTWRTIEGGLEPYKARLRVRSPGFLFEMGKLLDEIHARFHGQSYSDDRPLSGEYLLGYHCQRLDLRARPTAPAAGLASQREDSQPED